jgi:hypothetical protein
MSNQLATCNIVAKEALAILKNNTAFAKRANRNYEPEFNKSMSKGYANGNVINIKRPPRYSYRAGRVAQPQATVETTIPLTLQQGGCDLIFTSNELTTGLLAMQQKIEAAMASVITEIDRQGCDLMRTASFNIIGAPGTPPNTQALAVAAMTGLGQRLTEMGAPLKDRKRTLIQSPSLNSALVTGQAGLFNNQSRIGEQNNSGLFLDGFGMYAEVDQCIATHTNGTQVVTGTAVAAGLSGSSIACAALGGTITKGTKIHFPGVFAVNPQTRQSTGVLAQFTITADLLGGATALPISPALVPTGNFQNVTNATTAANFVIFGSASGSYTCSGLIHEDAFTLAMVPLQPLDGLVCSVQSDDGFSVRVMNYSDGANDTQSTRIDVLYGWAATYAELSCLYAL